MAQAVVAMQRSLAPDRMRVALAIMAAGLTLLLPAQVATIIAIASGAAAGLLLFRSEDDGCSEYIGLSLPKVAGVASAGVFLRSLL